MKAPPIVGTFVGENDTDRRRTMITSIDLTSRRDTAVLDAVRGLTPTIAARAAEIEAARRLPPIWSTICPRRDASACWCPRATTAAASTSRAR